MFAEGMSCELLTLSLIEAKGLFLTADNQKEKYKACVIAVNPIRYSNPHKAILDCSEVVQKIPSERFIYIDTMRYGVKADYYQSLKMKLGDAIQSKKLVKKRC